MFLVIALIQLSLAIYTQCKIPNCLACSVHTPFLCNNCELGYTRSVEGCVRSEARDDEYTENCMHYNGDKTCSQCKSGYSLAYNSCEPECDKDCDCIEPNVCLQNDQGLSGHLKNIRKTYYCYNCDYCNYFTDYCYTCSSGYYASYGDCYKCSSGCSECYNYYDCYDCKSGYTLDEGECYDNSTTIAIGVIVGPIITVVCVV